MRVLRSRSSDATFDLNLAPMLDIIVTIVPMLLLSVAFVEVKAIEVPTPQMVQQSTVSEPPKPETNITLKISKTQGLVFQITDEKGQTTSTNIGLNGGAFDYEQLYIQAARIKDLHPSVSKLQLEPEPNVPFDDLVQIMDQVRQRKVTTPQKISISDAATAQQAKIDYIFPDVMFANVGG